jgi:hypothetical protein
MTFSMTTLSVTDKRIMTHRKLQKNTMTQRKMTLKITLRKMALMNMA